MTAREKAQQYYDNFLKNIIMMENSRTRWMIEDYEAGYNAALKGFEARVKILVEALENIQGL